MAIVFIYVFTQTFVHFAHIWSVNSRSIYFVFIHALFIHNYFDNTVRLIYTLCLISHFTRSDIDNV